MRRTNKRPLTLAYAAAALCIGQAAAVVRANETACFGVTRYAGAGECCNTCSDLQHSTSDATMVANALSSGGYQYTYVSHNKAVDGWDFCNGSGGTCGDEVSPYGTDFTDVIFYSGHGFHSCGATSFSHIIMGDGADQPGDTCDPQTSGGNEPGQLGVLKETMVFGNGAGGDANIAIFAACQSMQYCVFLNGGYFRMMWGTAMNTVLGFHGDSYDNTENYLAYGSYVRSSMNNGIGDNWLDWLEADPDFDSDQCATALVVGASFAANDDQYANGGFNDFHNTGSHDKKTYYHECSCDPAAGPALPGC